jgi:hypothetical protein
MANFGQAMFVGSEVVVECGKKMSCCDREQAKAKCDNYNAEIANKDAPGPLNISPGSSELGSTKCTAQADSWRDFRDKMSNASTPAERKQIAIDNSVSPCVGEAVADRWERGRRTSRGLGVQMDHMIEVKWGGAASPEGLKALGSRVNNFFGSISKRVGDDMLKSTPPKEDITAIHFVCDPPCRPPKKGDENKNYSTGPAGKSAPTGPAGGPTRTYLAD